MLSRYFAYLPKHRSANVRDSDLCERNIKMAYQLDKYYHFISHAGSGRALNVYGNETISNNRNVVLWSWSNSNAQNWKVSIVNGVPKIFNALSNAQYALNIYRGSSNYGNCDVLIAAGNDTDSEIDVNTISADNNLYRIKLVNYNLFLTAKSNTDGGDVRWEAFTGAENQTWHFTTGSESGIPDFGSYQWVTPSTRVTQSFGGSHSGVDIGAVTVGVAGDPIYAMCSGVVKRRFDWTASQGTSGNASMGNAIFIQGNNPVPSIGGAYLRQLYMHMRDYALVSVGQTVTKGQLLGYMGTTGNSSGVHLHFGLQANSTDMGSGGTTLYVDRDWVNPKNYFSFL